MQHHKARQRLVCAHFHHNPTAGPGGQLEHVYIRLPTKCISIKDWRKEGFPIFLQMIWGASCLNGFDSRHPLTCSRTDILTSTILSVSLFKNSKKIGWNASEIADSDRAKRSPTKCTAFNRTSNWSVCHIQACTLDHQK